MTDANNSNMADRQPPSVTELAALYLSGAMTAPERGAFEARLASGDPECLAEVQRLQNAAQFLAESVQPASPPPALRERLLRVLDAEVSMRRNAAKVADRAASSGQVWRRWDTTTDDPMFTLRATEGAWEETGVPGVQVRRIFVDRPANRMTAMFRMAAGTEYPEHTHDGPEECYVLQGDLHVGDEFVMNAGDYQRALPGSEHGRQWTRSGCVLLVTCSLSDEMM